MNCEPDKLLGRFVRVEERDRGGGLVWFGFLSYVSLDRWVGGLPSWERRIVIGDNKTDETYDVLLFPLRK